MGRIYKNPPVVEAVCEFRIVPTKPWDLTIPGLLYQQVQDTFTRVEESSSVQITLDLQGNQVSQQAEPRVRFLTEDSSEAVQVGPNFLSIHQLRTYHTWEHFKERVFSILAAYRKSLKDEHELSFFHIGLRYINRLELASNRFDLRKSLPLVPQMPEPIPQAFPTFLVQSAIPYESPKGILRLVFGTVVPELVDHRAFMLDLEMFTLDELIPEMHTVSSWLEEAHLRIEEAFYVSFAHEIHKEIFEEAEE